ncbi:hypothetical protein FOCG_13301 [Fusarium oxysporum f. sp. radicis-lycopersici 26381]|nr:hypothetical protein FOCG_13301 [Fusarium oxysporum f. sp. radicis-lycopersici 26381]
MQSWLHLGASALMLANMVSGLNIKVDAKAGKSCEYTAPWQTLPELPPMPKANFEGTAPIDGIDLWYAAFGAPLKETKAKGLNPVVFLHGGFANSDYWTNQINHFKDHPYTLITIDSRAQGRSSDDISRPLTYDLMTEDVIGLMDHLGIDKFSTVGWSDGACISFDLVMNFTSRLDRSFAFGGTYSPENINATAAESPVFLEYMERIVDGDSEEAVTRSTPGEIHSWIWGSDLVILPGVSHFAFMQDPETFNVMVERFLEMPRFPGEL